MENERQGEREAGRKRGREKERQGERKIERKTGREMDRHGERQKKRKREWYKQRQNKDTAFFQLQDKRIRPIIGVLWNGSSRSHM